MTQLSKTSRAFFLITCCFLVVLNITGCSGRESKADSHSMYRANLERTGVYPAGGPSTLTERLWTFKTDRGVSSSPAISDGVVYFGSWDGNLYAVDTKTGQEKWKFKTGDKVLSSPTISGGAVYFGSNDGNLYAVK